MFPFAGFKPDKSVRDILLICKKIIFAFFTDTGLLFHSINYSLEYVFPGNYNVTFLVQVENPQGDFQP
jgi:hypothetical protein